MRVAALYDVHGNLPALEAVLLEVEREAPDVVLVGGDVTAGPFPVECLELLRSLGDRAVWIRGNADRDIKGWPAEQLSDEQRAFLRGLPGDGRPGRGRPRPCPLLPRLAPLGRGGDHGALADLRLEVALAGLTQQVVVHGHTHVAYDREFGLYRLICPGSVGMPYAELPGAYWGMFGPGYSPRITGYDFATAAERIRESAWPQAEPFAADNVLTVPSPGEAIEFFERMAAVDDPLL